jgi:hypothetical protein
MMRGQRKDTFKLTQVVEFYILYVTVSSSLRMIEPSERIQGYTKTHVIKSTNQSSV